jgi:hypothetical protein
MTCNAVPGIATPMPPLVAPCPEALRAANPETVAGDARGAAARLGAGTSPLAWRAAESARFDGLDQPKVGKCESF